MSDFTLDEAFAVLAGLDEGQDGEDGGTASEPETDQEAA
jgi:hypothetical protein